MLSSDGITTARTLCLAAVLVMGLLVLPAHAVVVTGELDINAGAVALSATGITFTTLPTTGVFVAAPGTLATTADLSFAAPSAANFITFAAAPTSSITSTSLSAGVFTSANCGAAPVVGQTCTPPSSPLNLVNTSTGVFASFTVQGTVSTAAGATPITGVYTLQFPDTKYQSVLTTLAGGGIVRASYSAEFSSTAGRFTIGGSLGLTAAGIDFSPSASVAAPADQFTIATPSTGFFTPLLGTTGAALDLLFATTPPETPVNVNNFLTFAADPLTHATLTFLEGGVFQSANCGAAPVAGQTCTPPLSPFMFANVAGGSIAIFDVHADLVQGPDTSPYVGLFSLQFAGLPFQQVLAQLAQGQSVTGLYSAAFGTRSPSTPTPEPGTVLLLAAGVVGMTVLRKRSRPRGRRD
jgi:hypothetical protein